MKVLLIKVFKKHIYETIFEEKICISNEEEQKHRHLFRNFHNPYIYDTGKDIHCVSSYMEVTNNQNIIHILQNNASKSRPQARPKNTEGTLLIHVYQKK